MRSASLVVLLALLPGLLLPFGLRMNLCLCGDAPGGSGATSVCAGMHCCAEPEHAARERGPIAAAPACAGCRSLVAPESPSTLDPGAADPGWLPHAADFTFVLPIVPSLVPRWSCAPALAVRGPPAASTILPLRI
jgi:hypothetical protein